MSFVIDAKGVAKVVLIMMHGFGTSAEDFKDLAMYISAKCNNVEIHVLDAFEELDGPNCRMWFPLTVDECSALFRTQEDQKNTLNKWKERIAIPTVKLEEYINKIMASNRSFNMKNIILAGFSQGAMMALHVGLKNSVGCVVSFSGVLLDDKVVNDRSTTNVLIVHGGKDDVLPIENMKFSCRALFSSKINYEVHIEDNMQHSINDKCIKKAVEFINKYTSELL